MKISQLSFSLSGGAGKVASVLAAKLGALGHQSTIETVIRTNLRTSPLSSLGTTIMAGFDEFAVKNSNSTSQFSLLRDFKPGRPCVGPDLDILNLHWVSGVASFGQIGALDKQVKAIFWTLHDMRPFTGGCHQSGSCNLFMGSCGDCPQARRPFRAAVSLNLTSKMNSDFLSRLTLVAPTQWIARAAGQSSLFRDTDLVVIPNPIDERFFTPLNKSVSYQDTEQDLICGVIAANLRDPNKRVETICETLHHLNNLNQGSKIRLFLIGGHGQEFAKKYDFVSSLGVLNTDDLVSVIDQFDLHISYSVEETAPLAIAECAARGVATLASNNHGARGAVETLGCGFVAKDDKEFIDYLKGALRKKAERDVDFQRKKRFRTMSAKTHSPEEVVSKYIAEYERGLLRNNRANGRAI